MNIQKLEKFNLEILQRYNTSRFSNAINCVMPGYFSGNDMLFVAQNPGELKNDVFGDIAYFDAYSRGDLSEMKIRYIQALKSNRGSYGVFINDIYDENWDKISITNVFKCPFIDNSIPKEIPELEKKILFKQIQLLNPKIIVTVGSVAKTAIQDDEIRLQYKILSMKHPSYLKRVGQYASEVKRYRRLLHNYL